MPDLAKEYQIEAWQIGPYVIKAVLNADPLARRPLFSWSFQSVPGSVWGNSPYDLMKDCVYMCTAAPPGRWRPTWASARGRRRG